MDILYFKTNNKISLFTELEIPFSETENDEVVHELFHYSEKDWFLVWLGEDKNEEGYYLFNIHLNGQENMDYFTQKLNNAILLSEPKTPKFNIL